MIDFDACGPWVLSNGLGFLYPVKQSMPLWLFHMIFFFGSPLGSEFIFVSRFTFTCRSLSRRLSRVAVKGHGVRKGHQKSRKVVRDLIQNAFER